VCDIDWHATGTWVQAVVSAVTIYFLIAAKNAANKQARYARKQAQAADASAAIDE
jgi:hypothetical protein